MDDMGASSDAHDAAADRQDAAADAHDAAADTRDAAADGHDTAADSSAPRQRQDTAMAGHGSESTETTPPAPDVSQAESSAPTSTDQSAAQAHAPQPATAPHADRPDQGAGAHQRSAQAPDTHGAGASRATTHAADADADEAQTPQDTESAVQGAADALPLAPPTPSTQARPPPGAPSEPRISDVAVEQLTAMFPNLHASTITDILRSKRGNLDASITMLLQISDPDYRPTPTREMPPPSAAYGPYLHAPPAAPTGPEWNPSALRYHPRMRHTRSAAAPAPEPSVPMHADAPPYATHHGYHSYSHEGGRPWPTPEDTKMWQDNLSRFTEVGLAKMGSTFSSLRQKAEAALRHHDVQNKVNKVRANLAASAMELRSEAMATPSRDTRWGPPPPSGRTYSYDQDARVVDASELEHLADAAPTPELPPRPATASSPGKGAASSSPPTNDVALPPLPPPKAAGKTSRPSWGQRYAKKTASTTAASTHTAAGSGSSSSANGAAPAKDPLAADAGTSATAPADDGAPTPASTKSSTDTTHSSTPHDAQKDSQSHTAPATEAAADDEEYIDNPFDDDD